jgi:glucan biosynthesis protein C
VLLGLSLAYAGLRRLRPARVGVTAGVGPRQLAAVAAVIAAGSFMMRLVSPLAADTFANLTWAAWPQATGLFTLGVLAGERGRLESLDRRWLRRLGWVAVAGLLALAVLAASALATDRGDAVAGGWTWQAAALALLEGLVAVGLSLWVVAWFRRRWDRRGPLVRRVGRGSYAAYVLHPPVLVLASMATRPLPLAPEGKFVLVAAVGVAASFTLGAALTWRRVVVHVERPRVA